MLSVNKKFLDEEYYRRVVERKYPELVKMKGKEIKSFGKSYNYNLNWRNFYIKNMYYMLEIEKVSKIPYFACKQIPERIFYSLGKYRKCQRWLLQTALNVGNEKIVNLIVETRLADFERSSLCSAVKGGNMSLVKRIYDYRLHRDLALPIFYAIRKNRKDIIEFLIKNETVKIEHWNYILSRICTSGEIDNIKYIIGKGANNILHCIQLINTKLINFEIYYEKLQGDYVSKYSDNLNSTLNYLESL